MNNIQLFINNYEIDLNENVTVPLNIWLANIREINKRTASYSKTINIPGTKQNDVAFGYTYDLQTSIIPGGSSNIGASFDRKKKSDFILVHDGSVLLTGTAELISAVEIDGQSLYNVVLYGELINLVTEIGDLELQDLDGTELTHEFTIPNITSSWDNNESYVYPLVDYGVVNTRMEAVTTDNFRPAIKLKWYWDKIFEEAGFEYESEFISGSFFGNLIMPFNGEELTRLEPIPEVYVTADDGTLPGRNFDVTEGVYYPFDVVLEDSQGLYDPSTQTYTAETAGKIDILFNYLSIIAAIPQPSGDPDEVYSVDFTVVVSIEVNGTTAQSNTFAFPERIYDRNMVPSIPDLSESETVDHNFNFININLNSGDQLRIKFEAFPNGDDFFYNVTKDQFWGGEVLNVFASQATTANIIEENIVGSELNYAQFVPKDIKQRDFLTGIMRLFNLFIEPDKDNANKLIIKQREDYYDTSIFNDWNPKLDVSRSIKNEVLEEGQVRTLQLKYKHDDDDYYLELYKNRWGREYGEKRINTGYEFNRDTEDALELPFGTAVPIQYRGGRLLGDSQIEVLDASPSRVRVAGYQLQIDDGVLPADIDLPPFERALIGRSITLGGQNHIITDLVSPYEFVINGSIDVPASGLITVDGTDYRIFNGTYTYTGVPDKVVPAIYESEDGNTTRSSYNSIPRVLYYNGKLTGANSWNISQKGLEIEGLPTFVYNDSETKSQFLTTYPFTSHVIGSTPTSLTEDLLFQQPNEIFWNLPSVAIYPENNNLFTNYHQEIIDLIINTDSRLVTAYFNLEPNDINNLSLSDKIYIDGSYFIINKIIDYNATQPGITKVELIKTPENVANPSYELQKPLITGLEFTP